MDRTLKKSELPLRKPDQFAVPRPPDQLVLFPRLRRSRHRDGGCNKMGCTIVAVIVGAILTCDEDTLRFDASDSTPSRLAAISSSFRRRRRRCVAKARIDEKVLQRVVQRRADVLSREPRRMREAPRRTEQNVGLRRGCENGSREVKTDEFELRGSTRSHRLTDEALKMGRVSTDLALPPSRRPRRTRSRACGQADAPPPATSAVLRRRYAWASGQGSATTWGEKVMVGAGA